MIELVAGLALVIMWFIGLAIAYYGIKEAYEREEKNHGRME